MRRTLAILAVAMLTACTIQANEPTPAATSTDPRLATPTPEPSTTAMMAAHNCDASDMLAVMGEGFTLRQVPSVVEYPGNSRGWHSIYVSRWDSPASEDQGARVFTCLTVLYENQTNAAFENNHHSLRLWVEGNLDMAEHKVHDPPAIGDGFRAAGYRHHQTVTAGNGVQYSPIERFEGVARYQDGALAVYLYTTEADVGGKLNPALARAASKLALRRMTKAVVDMGVRLDAKFRAQGESQHDE